MILNKAILNRPLRVGDIVHHQGLANKMCLVGTPLVLCDLESIERQLVLTGKYSCRMILLRMP